MRYIDGLSIREISDILAIPEGTVKSRLHKVLKVLGNDPRTKNYFEIK